MHSLKNVKAGILLHALLLVFIFSLFTQFYLQNQVSNYHIHQQSNQSTLAYAIAELTLENISSLPASTPFSMPQEGNFSFSSGNSHYKLEKASCTISVSLNQGNIYQYTFLLPSQKS